MKRRTDRILTTHVGSLPRPVDLLDMMKTKLTGEGGPVDATVYNQELTDAVAECVSKQAECGLDIITDGELSKPGFFVYVKERLAGFEPRPDQQREIYATEVAVFPRSTSDSTPVTASMKGHAFMSRRLSMSSTISYGSMPVSIHSKLPTRATSTSITCGRTSSCPTAKRLCLGCSPTPTISSNTRS